LLAGETAGFANLPADPSKNFTCEHTNIFAPIKQILLSLGRNMAYQAAAATDFSQPKVGALIRARRRQLHMTLEEICQAAGISKGYLSQVERDQATPSLGTLAQIARSLDVGMDYFIATPSVENSLTRAEERPQFSVAGSSILYERIATDFAGNILSSFVMNVPAGYRSETVSHEGEEILFVLEGTIKQKLDDEEIEMKAGDSLHFRGNRPHAWRNDSGKPARLLWTGTLPLFRGRAASADSTAKTKKTSKKLSKEENDQ
jgi:transcriptional regulator with XRE-family HTH domain